MPKYLDEAGVRKLWTKTKQKASEAQNNAVATAGNYTVNGKKISSNPTLTKTDVGLGNVTNDAQIPLSQKGAVNGVATLGTDGKVPTSQLPSYVDDVVEFNGKSTFPAKGETGKIYVDTSDNKTYRWSGTAYVEISASLALGETSSTAYAGDKGKTLATKVSTLESTVGNIPDIMLTSIGREAEDNGLGNAITIDYLGYQESNKGTITDYLTIYAATTTAAGVMSKADKAKLDGISAGAEVNQNAFSNVVVGSTTIAADSKTDSLTLVAGSNVTITPDATNDKITIAATNTTYGVATTSANGLMSKEDKSKLAGIAAGAEVNQNAFSNVVVGSTTIAADSKTDSLTLVAGSNVTITPDGTNDKITIAATNTTYGVATTSANGLMSAADKKILDYYNDSRGNYLEVYSSGFIYYADKVEIGNLYSDSLDDLLMVTIPLKAATTTNAGAMSAADKTKLDGIVALTDTEIDAILV